MKEAEKILTKMLLTQINTELVFMLSRPAALKQNTTTYNILVQKLESWQKHLQIISNSAARHKSVQNLRSQNIHSLPPKHRHSEQQSINDNLKNVDDVKRLIEKAEQSIGELLLNALNPSESEAIFNAITQAMKLQNWSQKLTKLNCSTHDAETTTLIQEATALNRHNQHNARSSHGAMPIQSMLLIILVLLTIAKKTLRQKSD